MTKLLKSIIIILGVFGFIIGCSSPLTINSGATTTTIEQVEEKVNYSFNLAKLKAMNHILATSGIDGKWENAEISNSFFWYNPVVENRPAYIEFKVRKNGNDQGYVIVSLTESDFEIPEYHTEGKTMYENLQDKAETLKIKGTRFNSFSYMGEITTSRSNNKKVFLGTLDYLNDIETTRSVERQYEEYLNNYIKKREDIGGIGGSKEELENYYKVKRESEENNKKNITRGNPTPPYNSPISAEVGESNLLPTYGQYPLHSGLSGCSPTAAAIIFAYWYRKHGRYRLFSGMPSLTSTGMTQTERNVIESLGSYMKTEYRDNAGWTTTFNAWDGMWKFVANKNYSHWIIRWYLVDHNSDEGQHLWVNTTNDWNSIYGEIQSNRPSILSYDDGGGHSAVIYKTVIHRDVWNSTVNDVYCSIITGWGDGSNSRKTINTGSWEFIEVVTCNIW